MDTFDNPRRREEIRKVTEQAAEWFTLFEDGTGSAEERAAFSKWMTESPLHVRAFLNVSAVDRMVEGVDPEQELAIVSTGAHGTDAGAVSLYAHSDHDGMLAASAVRSIPARRRSWIKGLAAAAAVLLAVAVWHFVADLRSQRSYTTGIGEQRSIELNDGSLVHLNAKSRLEVRFSAQARELHLHRGEALFKVEHDATKPFRVYVDESVVQAIGTQFDIDRRADRITVSVLEGVVQVSSNDAASAVPPARLTAGQSINIASNGKVTRPVPAKVTEVTAWRQRRLVFDEDTLADIASEFNRYNRVPQLRIEGEAVRERRYAAVFDADDPEPLLRFLKKDPELAFEARGDELIIRPREYESTP
jgi:transmembrane sensor